MYTDSQKVLVTAEEGAELISVSPLRFIRLFDKGHIRPEFGKDGRYVFDLRKLRGLDTSRERPEHFPEEDYASIDQVVKILDITRKTFYNRVKRGVIKIHRSGKRTFVLRADLYANDELF